MFRAGAEVGRQAIFAGGNGPGSVFLLRIQRARLFSKRQSSVRSTAPFGEDARRITEYSPTLASSAHVPPHNEIPRRPPCCNAGRPGAARLDRCARRAAQGLPACPEPAQPLIARWQAIHGGWIQGLRSAPRCPPPARGSSIFALGLLMALWPLLCTVDGHKTHQEARTPHDVQVMR